MRGRDDDAGRSRRGERTARENANGGPGDPERGDGSPREGEPAEYKVGKYHPPLHSRFKKGEPSANPNGRPKKDRSIEGFKREALSRKVDVLDERGRTIQITTAQGIIEQQVAKAYEGNQAAIDKVFPWIAVLFPAEIAKAVAKIDDASRAILNDQVAILQILSEAEDMPRER